ncbi:MAG: FAD-binding oxidoreductase [Nitrososphaerota archaeon]
MVERVRFLVVGGGSTGTAIAYYLSREAGRDVLLLEANRVGSGQTGYSTAIIRLHYSTPEVARMALTSYRVFERFEDLVGGSCGFRRVGFVLAVPERLREGLERNVAMLRSLGVETWTISPDEVKDLIPQADVEGIASAAYEPGSGFAEPTETALSFARAAAENGARIIEGERVTKVVVEGNEVTRVVTERGEYAPETLVLATGVWTQQIASTFGRDVPMKVLREEIGVFTRPGDFRGEHPVFADLGLDFYMRPHGDAETYVGSIEPPPTAIASPDEGGRPVSRETYLSYHERISRRFPAFERSPHLVKGWTGLYDVTPDWHPVICRDPEVRNLIWAFGLSGHGFKLAPAIGMSVRDLALGRRPELFEPDHFSIDRFSRGRPITTTYGIGVVS